MTKTERQKLRAARDLLQTFTATGGAPRLHRARRLLHEVLDHDAERESARAARAEAARRDDLRRGAICPDCEARLRSPDTGDLSPLGTCSASCGWARP